MNERMYAEWKMREMGLNRDDRMGEREKVKK